MGLRLHSARQGEPFVERGLRPAGGACRAQRSLHMRQDARQRTHQLHLPLRRLPVLLTRTTMLITCTSRPYTCMSIYYILIE